MVWNAGLFMVRKAVMANPPPAERALLEALRGRGVAVQHQQPMLGRYFCDLYFAGERVNLEVDGPEHRTERAREADRRRDAFLLRRGVLVVRVTNDAALQQPNAVADQMIALLRRRGVRIPRSSLAGAAIT